ncbi:MAG TPA: tetratricopeptide repeat protein [Candidatus Sumerlaeota bacterium]|nr:tetratricopeptide repeat protein [Candidatus Sumerlaeota bacterium]
MAVEMTGRRQAEQALGRSPLKSSEISRWWRNRAIASMSRNPLRVVKLAFAKMRYFWGRPDLGQVYSLDHMGQVMPAMKWPLFSGALLGPLALAGLVLAFMQKNVKGRTASGFVLLYMISLLPFFMTARYRLPVAGLLCLLSAHAAISFVESLRSREWFRAAALGVGIALAAFLLNNHSLVRDRMSREGFYNSLGLMRQMGGDLEGARREFETALQEREIPKIRVNLGRVHHLQRDLEGALTCYIKALKSEPQNGRSHFYAGQCLVELGRNDEALPHLESAAVQDPDPPPLLWYNLAFLQLEQGRHSEASENMARYLLARPEDIQAADLFRKMGGGLNAIPVTKPEGAKP